MPSERLTTLLRHARSATDFSWRGVAAALGDLYHPQMSLADVMHHLTAAYAELTEEPRFAVPAGPAMLANLLLAPVKGVRSVELMGPRSTEQTYSIEAFYNSIAAHMLGALMMARVDWCQEQFNAPVPAASAKRRPLCRDCADEVVRQGTAHPVCPNSGQPCGF